MVGQLNHLLAMTELPNVTIRIVPVGTPIHSLAGFGDFVIFDFPRDSGREPEPSTVFRDGFTVGQYTDRAAEVEQYAAAWNGLEDVALDVGESKELIKAVAEEHAP
jgi:hypothetical protein